MRERKPPAKTPAKTSQSDAMGAASDDPAALTGAQRVQVIQAGVEAVTAALELAKEKQRTLQSLGNNQQAIRLSDNEVRKAEAALEQELAALGVKYRELEKDERGATENHRERMADLAGRQEITREILQARREGDRRFTTEELATLMHLYGPPKA